MTQQKTTTEAGNGELWCRDMPQVYGLYLWRASSKADATACIYCSETRLVQWIGAPEECEPPNSGQWCSVASVLGVLSDAADALEFCEGALVDHFAGEEGLHPDAARRVAWMASEVIRKVGRQSNLYEASQQPCS